MREYQLRSTSSYVLPRSVYYQCIWTVRDSARLHEIASDFSYDENPVRSAARERQAAIDAALRKIPVEYREGIIDNINQRVPYGDIAHENTWKKWKQRFIYELAVNLMLI